MSARDALREWPDDDLCLEDPCGECHWCRFHRPAREAELPTPAPEFLQEVHRHD